MRTFLGKCAVRENVALCALGVAVACAPPTASPSAVPSDAVPTRVAPSAPPTAPSVAAAPANAIAITSGTVTLSGKVVDSMARDEQFALLSKGGDTTKPLVEALKSGLEPNTQVSVRVQPDVAYLSVGRVMLALLALGFDSVSLELPSGPAQIALARGIYLHGEDGLLVLIATQGVSLKGPGGNVAPGCHDIGPGLAIPRTGSTLAYDSIRDCVLRLVQVDAHLGRSFLAANPDTPFADIAETAKTLAAAGAPLIGLRF